MLPETYYGVLFIKNFKTEESYPPLICMFKVQYPVMSNNYTLFAFYCKTAIQNTAGPYDVFRFCFMSSHF